MAPDQTAFGRYLLAIGLDRGAVIALRRQRLGAHAGAVSNASRPRAAGGRGRAARQSRQARGPDGTCGHRQRAAA